APRRARSDGARGREEGDHRRPGAAAQGGRRGALGRRAGRRVRARGLPRAARLKRHPGRGSFLRQRRRTSMNPWMIFLNVYALFAIATIIACWLYALVAIHHRKMRTATWVPLVAGVVAAICLADGGWWKVLLGFVGGAFATSIFVAYVYGWARSAEFN